MAWRSTRRFRTNAPYFDFHTAVDRFADGLERGEGLVGGGLPLALRDFRGLCGCDEAEEHAQILRGAEGQIHLVLRLDDGLARGHQVLLRRWRLAVRRAPIVRCKCKRLTAEPCHLEGMHQEWSGNRPGVQLLASVRPGAAEAAGLPGASVSD